MSKERARNGSGTYTSLYDKEELKTTSEQRYLFHIFGFLAILLFVHGIGTMTIDLVHHKSGASIAGNAVIAGGSVVVMTILYVLFSWRGGLWKDNKTLRTTIGWGLLPTLFVITLVVAVLHPDHWESWTSVGFIAYCALMSLWIARSNKRNVELEQKVNKEGAK